MNHENANLKMIHVQVYRLSIILVYYIRQDAMPKFSLTLHVSFQPERTQHLFIMLFHLPPPPTHSYYEFCPTMLFFLYLHDQECSKQAILNPPNSYTSNIRPYSSCYPSFFYPYYTSFPIILQPTQSPSFIINAIINVVLSIEFTIIHQVIPNPPKYLYIELLI